MTAEVWVAFNDSSCHSVAATKEGAMANLDDYLSNFRDATLLQDWHEPQLPEYRDGTTFSRWHQIDPFPSPQRQTVCLYTVREATA